MTGAGWHPHWRPHHDYTAGAVVLPTTFAGFLWGCTVAGTTGAVEPAWPDPYTGTVTIADGGVTWQVKTGFRMAFQDGIMSVCTAFAAANPTIVRRVSSVRPRSMQGELPVLWLGTIDETVALQQNTRRRDLTAELHYVDTVPDPDQYNSRSNFLVDAILEPLTAGFHAAGGASIMEPTLEVEPRDLDEGGTLYPEVVFTIRGYITEGRT